MLRHTSILLTALLALALALPACLTGSEVDEPGGVGDAAPGNFDRDVPPMTEGDWIKPDPDITWQWQLGGDLNTSYDVDLYDIDLFDSTAARIADLHDDGRIVLCYFSAGSREDWRPDASDYDADVIGKPLDDWPGERWVDIRSANVQRILTARLDLAASKGCDGVEPDNVDAWDNDNTGLPITFDDQIAFNRWLANAAHERGLTVALKNASGQIDEVLDYFDLELNEECHANHECVDYQPFLDAGKAVLNVEYTEADTHAAATRLAGDICASSNDDGYRTLILPLDLDDSFRVDCGDW